MTKSVDKKLDILPRRGRPLYSGYNGHANLVGSWNERQAIRDRLTILTFLLDRSTYKVLGRNKVELLPSGTIMSGYLVEKYLKGESTIIFNSYGGEFE